MRFNFFRRKKPPDPIDPWDLQRPLLHWSEHDPFTVGASFEGVQVLGATGAGKSSGPVRTLTSAYLSAGYGGIFFCVKPDDAEQYTKWVREAGRERDLIVISDSLELRHNALQAERERSRTRAALVENLAAMLTVLTTLCEQRSGGGGAGENMQFFKQASEQLARHALTVLVFAGGDLTLRDLYRLIVSAPQTREQARSEAWQLSSFCFERMVAASKAELSASEEADLDLTVTYFMEEWCAMGERTRASIQSTLMAALDPLCHGIARELLSTTTNVTPEMCYAEGRVVIVDLPILRYYQTGRLIQAVIRYSWQRALNERDTRTHPRPVFLTLDECHLLMAPEADQQFQTTARSSRTAVLYSTQSISNMLDVCGSHSEPLVHGLLACLGTKILCQLTCTKSIDYVQSLLGRRRQILVSGSSNDQGGWLAPLIGGEEQHTSATFSEAWEPQLEASDLQCLARGGPPRYEVGAILFQSGKRFHSTGRTFMPVTFRQKP